ncbi:hypothetical protein HPP92_007787 [Vanilla planifolia]|uniref:Uncharacterized protein n=1 Tax=Vanilla planifolia TaxID=51239 RepID=A0A835RGP6_VANPL|nr:hypothetical protein HPP92_007787 [Vanilla planifolia]
MTGETGDRIEIWLSVAAAVRASAGLSGKEGRRVAQLNERYHLRFFFYSVVRIMFFVIADVLS